MKIKRIIKNQKGAAFIEFAIVLLLLVFLAIGIGEFGMFIYNQQVITNASREGARAGIAREDRFGASIDTNDIIAIVNAYCTNRLITFQSGVNPIIEFPDGPAIGDDFTGKGFQDDFSVSVKYDYHFLVPSLFNLGPSITLKGLTLMKMEPALI